MQAAKTRNLEIPTLRSELPEALASISSHKRIEAEAGSSDRKGASCYNGLCVAGKAHKWDALGRRAALRHPLGTMKSRQA